MRKIISLTLVLILCLGVLSIAAFAANASASLSGPNTVRAGDTITLTFKLSGSSISGASGTLSYDSSKLELKGTEQKISSPWIVEFNGNEFVAYDNNLENPITKSTSLFTVKFLVKSSLKVGDKLSVSFTNVTASDGTADTVIGKVTYSATIAAPKSTDNALKMLTLSNATLSPAFDPDVTSYTAEVPFDVSELDIKIACNDGSAKAEVNSPTLIPGGTTKVTVTVTAENGAERTYTISVKRAQDPNYVPSSNNNLASIEVEGFLLSPVFDPELLSYVIWLPYETESVSISCTPEDQLASAVVIGGENLAAGQDNEIQIVCAAENGDTKTYTIIAKRAAAHSETPTEPDPSEPSDPSAPTETQPPLNEPEYPQPEASLFDDIWVLVIAAVLCIALGFCFGILVGKKWEFDD